jgi:D-alanyl-D-alanine carboxypeptidase (penicillin-binding protein 5/6)
MNAEARRLHLSNTHYANPIGLDARGNYSSAADLAQLTRRLMRNALFRRIVDSPQAILRTGTHVRRVRNRNLLVGRLPWITGVKTGHTLGAGYVLVGSARRMGLNLASVVLGASSEAGREKATLDLLDYGFGRYQRLTAYSRGETVSRVDVRYSDRPLPLRAVRSLRLTVPRGARLHTRLRVRRDLEGPIRRGERVGTAVAVGPGGLSASVPLAAAAAVPAPGLADRLLDQLESPVALLLFGAALVAIGVYLARSRARRVSAIA